MVDIREDLVLVGYMVDLFKLDQLAFLKDLDCDVFATGPVFGQFDSAKGTCIEAIVPVPTVVRMS